jgi:hypothetical protein
MTRSFRLAGVLFAALTTTAIAAAPKELIVVLKWNPNNKLSMPTLDMTGGLVSFSVAPVVDKRDKGTQIGENIEGKAPVPVYTKSDVAAFVGEHLLAQLKRIGLDARVGETGERVLRAEMVEFWVAEGNHYNGSVRLKVTITDTKGKELWTGLVGGGSDNFGRSLKPDNYTEAYSNSIQELAAKLVSAPGFRASIAKAP